MRLSGWWREGSPRKRCPLCGGKIIVSELYQVPHEYRINTKTGKQCKTRLPGRVEYTEETGFAYCENNLKSCTAYWNTDEFTFDPDERFIDLKYEVE